MKVLLFVLISLMQVAGAESAKLQFERIVRYQEKVGGHSIKVELRSGKYDFSKHKITGGEGEGPAKIDGYWGQWTPWTQCKNGEQRTRTRKCDKPKGIFLVYSAKR